MGKLFDWAQTAAAPLAGYATGLLGRALSVQEVAAKHPQDAAHLVTLYSTNLPSAFILLFSFQFI